MTTIAFYLLLAFLFTIHEASKQNVKTHKTNICNLTKNEILMIVKFLKLRETLRLGMVCGIFKKSIPKITKENKKYFKPFLNHGYDNNIGFIVSNYCFTLTNDTEKLRLINENMHHIGEQDIYCISSAFALHLNDNLILYSGTGAHEKTIPMKLIKGVVKWIEVNKRIIFTIIKTNEGTKIFTIGDPNFYVPPKIQQDILAGDARHFIPMCTASMCAVWNVYTRKVYSWGKFDVSDKNQIASTNEILENVDYACTTKHAICIKFTNHKVAAWGDSNFGGKIPKIMKLKLKNIGILESTAGAFAVLSYDRKVFAWGHPNFGGEIPEHFQPLLKNIRCITSNQRAFAAWAFNGNVFSWGDPNYGGTPSEEIQAQLYNVECVFAYGLQQFKVSFNDGRKSIVWP